LAVFQAWQAAPVSAGSGKLVEASLYARLFSTCALTVCVSSVSSGPFGAEHRPFVEFAIENRLKLRQREMQQARKANQQTM
jgi:hypothetical protein